MTSVTQDQNIFQGIIYRFFAANVPFSLSLGILYQDWNGDCDEKIEIKSW